MATKVEDQSTAVYEAAYMAALQSKEGKAKIFSADEMLDLGVVDNMAVLKDLMQSLANSCLVRLFTLDSKPHFALRTRDVASKMCNLSRDEAMIYTIIEGAGTNGMWVKRIKDRTGIVQTAITKAIKLLESRQLIKQFASVKNPSQKTYILSYLDPGEGVSGGPWHSDTEFDMELIGVTADAVIRFVESKSWSLSLIHI